jgi:hypothetical protein
MGEGYADYFALTILNYYRRKRGAAESLVYGGWLAAANPARANGLRRHAYGPAFPGTYASSGQPEYTLPHEFGQVWCEALLRMNAALGRGSADAGDELGWRLVVASMPLIDAREVRITFPEGRRALLRAFDNAATNGIIPGDVPATRAAVANAFSSLQIP